MKKKVLSNATQDLGELQMNKWDEPKSTYEPVYPNNNVRETYGSKHKRI